MNTPGRCHLPVLALVCGALPVFAQEPAPCQVVSLEGHVRTGETFQTELDSGLVFRLEPETHPQNPPGWTIKVIRSADATRDYVMVATPPYRFSNPRYLDTSYGLTAEQALAWTPRTFAFVATEAAYDAAWAALEVVLWPGNHTDTQVTQARARLDALRTYEGTLWIEDGATTPPDTEAPSGRIEWIRFRVTMCVP